MAPKYILEQFIESELLINITEHMVSFRAMHDFIKDYAWSTLKWNHVHA